MVMKAKAKKAGKMNQGKAIFCRKNKVYEVIMKITSVNVKDEIGIYSAGGIHKMSYKFFNEYYSEPMTETWWEKMWKYFLLRIHI